MPVKLGVLSCSTLEALSLPIKDLSFSLPPPSCCSLSVSSKAFPILALVDVVLLVEDAEARGLGRGTVLLLRAAVTATCPACA
jgi:hypothetical protein